MNDSEYPFSQYDFEQWIKEVIASDDPNFHRYILTHGFEVFIGKPGSLGKKYTFNDDFAVEVPQPLPLVVPPELRQ